MRLVALLPAVVAVSLFAAGCGTSTVSSPVPSSVAGGSVASEVKDVTDTSSLPATVEAKATVSALSNAVATTMSTGGVLTMTLGALVSVDGTGYELSVPAPDGTIVAINSTAVGATRVPLSPGSSVCISVPDPNAPGQYVKMDIAGSRNMTFGNSDFSTTPCLG